MLPPSKETQASVGEKAIVWATAPLQDCPTSALGQEHSPILKAGAQQSFGHRFFFLIRRNLLCSGYTMNFLAFLKHVRNMTPVQLHWYICPLPWLHGEGMRSSPAAQEAWCHPQLFVGYRQGPSGHRARVHTTDARFAVPLLSASKACSNQCLLLSPFEWLQNHRRRRRPRPVGPYFWWLVLSCSLPSYMRWESSSGIGSWIFQEEREKSGSQSVPPTKSGNEAILEYSVPAYSPCNHSKMRDSSKINRTIYLNPGQ